jgi:phosphopantothenoylcysteine decarboxylase
MARLILGVTGSVAAIRTPALFSALTAAGHYVRIVATKPALYFFYPNEIDGAGHAFDLYRDADEWPGTRYDRGDQVLHIELRKWADLLIVAPLDANTLGKFALGLSDNCLSCVFRAWDFTKPVILAPAMNTFMWDSAVTLRHLRQLLADHSGEAAASVTTLEAAPAAFARHAPKIILVPPQAKRLACGDVGIGAMAEVTAIAEVVRLWAAQVGPLGES